MGVIRVPKISRKDEDEVAKIKFKNRTRFIILILTTLCLSISQSNALTLNFTIICMSSSSEQITFTNESEYNIEYASNSLFTSSQKNMLFSVVAIGAMITVYPCMLLIQRYGSRGVVTLFGLFSAICTAIIPLAVDLGYPYLLVVRFLQGTGVSPVFTLIGIVTIQWSMIKQNSFYIAVLTCFFQFAPMFTMPVAGALCSSSYGWQSVYYVHGFVTCFLYLIFFYFYREEPQSHRLVSNKELLRIRRNKAVTTEREAVPYWKIITSPAILACWITSFGNFLGIQTTMQFTPTYLNKVMGFPVSQTGVFSAIPQFVTFFLKIIAGVLADKMTCCTPRLSVKIFNTLAVAGMGIAFLIQAYIPITMPFTALGILILSTSIIGFNCGAFFRSSAIVAGQFNHFVMAVNSFINCLCALLTPIIVNVFVVDDSWEEWWFVWIVHGLFLITVNTVFVIFGKGEPAEWTKTKAAAAPKEKFLNNNESSMENSMLLTGNRREDYLHF